ncbi:MAG TPA: serine/threonine-protein kinase, partial [Archangium sp.]|uniref:serine/threonine protein kinase n=1 Tax=Archangium sp. TaxID=1872627 RepID=UPI002ED7F70A
MGVVFRHPEPGEKVGDYRIVEKLGAGGFGTVFKAERAGLFFAVKFLWSNELGARERREISILLRLDNPYVVRFRACDRWLDPERGPPYIVMDYVEGRTLRECAEVDNPSARESARITLGAALTLGEVHLEGVFHRDLKPENILIQGRNERPVLIDFGVGSYVGAPLVTRNGALPGTHEFRSPEACLFNRANTELAHYEFSATDELWALGVTFYWLLTNVLPFGDRHDRKAGGLTERIIHQRPLAPHELNPRVPRALSDISMKMLEKRTEDRYASVAELCAALDGALADAEADASWDLPLFEPDEPVTMAPPVPREEGEEPARAAPGVSVTPRASTLVPGLAAVVLGALLFVWVLHFQSGSAPLHTSSEALPTRQAKSGHEVAPPSTPLDLPVGHGAGPIPGSTSAPVMMTMPPKDDSEKPQQKKQKVRSRVAKVGLVCTTLTGCTAAAPQHVVRPTPEPAPCPAGAVETMKKLGIAYTTHDATFLTPRTMNLTVQEGDTTIKVLLDWQGLPGDTLLYGRLIFGEGRVFGRLTEARTPSGDTFKVCLEVWDIEGGRGVIREPDGGPGLARVFSSV